MAMDVKEVRFHVLDVGQGACNYVEIVDSADKVIHNILIDFGTSSAHEIAQKNLEWLRNRIKDRADPRIDVLMLTHGDLDHYNLVSQLFPALDPEATTRIGLVRYGGLAWRYRANKDVEKGKSLIKALKRYCANVAGFTDVISDYDRETQTYTQLWPSAPEATDPVLRILLANTPHPKDNTLARSSLRSPNGVAVNTKSLIYDIVWSGCGFVGTGDATAYTFNKANEHLKDAAMPPVPMLTMPHHGSRTTTYDLGNSLDLPSTIAIDTVENFANLFNSWCVSVSANEANHFHPSLYVLDQFGHYCSPTIYWSDPYIGTDAHFLTPYVDVNMAAQGSPKWPSQDMYATLQTTWNIYPTMYYVSDWVEQYLGPPLPATTPAKPDDDPMQTAPVRGRNWLFTLKPNKVLNVTSTGNPHGPSTLLVAFTAAQPAAAPARDAATRLALAAPAPISAMSRRGVQARGGLVALSAGPAFAARPQDGGGTRLTGLRAIQ